MAASEEHRGISNYRVYIMQTNGLTETELRIVIGQLERQIDTKDKRIVELEQQLDKLTQSDIDKIMAMSDEQITALTVMEGHNPEDIASLGKKIAEIALLKQQLSDLRNKKAVLLSNDCIEDIRVRYSNVCLGIPSELDEIMEFARLIETESLKANNIKVGE